MPREIETGDYKGIDRRNGGRIKISFGDYFKILTSIIGILVAGVIGWTTLKMQVKANAEDIAEATTDFKEYKSKNIEINTKQNNDILILQQDTKAIREDVQDIKISQEKTNQQLYNQDAKLNKILGKLEKLDDGN